MESGNTTAGSLLDIMSLRLKMADDGLTRPPPAVVAATRQLVGLLSSMDAGALVRIEIDHEISVARYVEVGAERPLLELDFGQATEEPPVDWTEVSREAHELEHRHGRNAHAFAVGMADRAGPAGDYASMAFWRAVAATLAPRAADTSR